MNVSYAGIVDANHVQEETPTVREENVAVAVSALYAECASVV